jgi:predicted nucleic acid-binding protein
MMAAMALANNLPLYTTNLKDFLGLQEIIQVEAVRRPA